jgi:hypothetical protein
MVFLRIVMGLALLVCMLPLGSVLLTSVLANSLGCRVDEGSVHPCYLFGISIGDALYAMGVMGWLMLVTLPLAAILVLAWIVIETIHFVKNRPPVIR